MSPETLGSEPRTYFSQGLSSDEDACNEVAVAHEGQSTLPCVSLSLNILAVTSCSGFYAGREGSQGPILGPLLLESTLVHHVDPSALGVSLAASVL